MTLALVACGREPRPAPPEPAAPAPARIVDTITEPLEHFEPDTDEQRHLLALARAGIEQGRRGEARVTLQTLHDTRARSRSRALGVGLLARLEMEQGQVDAAVERMLQLRLDSPSSAEIEHVLGECLASAGRPIEAEGAWRRALRIRPDFLPPWAALATLLHANGREDDADEIRLRLERHLDDMAHRLARSESESERALLLEDFARWTPDERVSRALVRALGDEVHDLRLLAALALGNAGTSSARRSLETFLGTLTEPAERAIVEQAMAQLPTAPGPAPGSRRRATP